MKMTLDSIRDIRLYQPIDGYRFSADSVILYSFVNLKKTRRILDLGSGSGVVGLMLSKKYKDASVILVELQESLYRLAEKNIVLNELEKRVEAIHCDIKDLDAKLGKFDLIVSNPPFRKPKTGKLSIVDSRAIARHELRLELDDLLSACSKFLVNGGRCFLIYHPQRLSELFEKMNIVKLEPKRLKFVHGRKHSEAKMVLVEAVRQARPGIRIDPPLFVFNDDGSYTEEMISIYKT